MNKYFQPLFIRVSIIIERRPVDKCKLKDILFLIYEATVMYSYMGINESTETPAANPDAVEQPQVPQRRRSQQPARSPEGKIKKTFTPFLVM